MSEQEIDSGQGVTDPVVDEAATAQAGATEETASPEQADEQKAETPDVEYSDFSMPEGIEIDAELLGEFKPYAKELGLDQDGAQRLVDMAAKLASKVQQASIENWQKQKSEWAEQSRADKDFGGKDFEANLGVALKAIDAFGSPALKAILDESGLGSHPEIVRFAYKIGKAIGDDRNLVSGSSPGQKDILKALYPTM